MDVEASEAATEVEATGEVESTTEAEGEASGLFEGEASAGEAEGEEFEAEGEAEGEREEAEAEGEPKTYRVKVDGREEEVSLEELQKGYSRTKTFTKRMQEAKRIRQEAEEVLSRAEERLYTAPDQLLAQLGPEAVERAVYGLLENRDPAVQAAVERAVKATQAGPEERSRRQLAEEKRRLEMERRKWESEQARKAAEVEAERAREELTQGFTATLGEAGLPATPAMMSRMAGVYRQLHTPGEPWSRELMQQAAEIVREEITAEMREFSGGFKETEKLEALLGKEAVEAISQKRIAQAKKAASAPPKPRAQAAPKKRQGAPRLMLEELREQRELARLRGE